MASIITSSIIAAAFFLFVFCNVTTAQEVVDECKPVEGSCYNKSKALELKIIAIFAILVTSVIGVVLPLLSRSIPALRPERKFFVLIKAFASGVILATGYMHLLPDSYESLNSPCLPENPWRKFPFTAFIVMISAVFTLMVDSFMLTFFNRKKGQCRHKSSDEEEPPSVPVHHSHGGIPIAYISNDGVDKGISLKRNRIIAQVSREIHNP